MSVYNEEKDTVEKVGRLYVMRGKEQIEVDELHSGDIGALAKLSNTSTQDTLSLKGCKYYHSQDCAAWLRALHGNQTEGQGR